MVREAHPEVCFFELVVHPFYERRGIGRALLPLACDVLKEGAHATAVLTTEAGTRAERFYPTDGWTEVGRKEDGQTIFQKSLLASLLPKLRVLTQRLIIRPATITDRRPRLRQAIVELQDYERTQYTTRLPGQQVADLYLDWMLHSKSCIAPTHSSPVHFAMCSANLSARILPRLQALA